MFQKNKGLELESETKEWNMMQEFLIRLGRRLEMADQAAISANVYLWYRILSKILNNVAFRLEEKVPEWVDGGIKTMEYFDMRLKEIELELKNSPPRGYSSAHREAHLMLLTDVEKKLFMVDRDLNKALFKAGLIFPQSKKFDLLTEVMRAYE